MSARDRGWGAPKPYGHHDIVDLEVRGCPFPAGVHRDAHAVMASLVAEYFDRVSPPNPPYAWGHAYRRIGGSSSWSNHAWGLAVDIRNDLYPQGQDNMTAAQKRACRDIAVRHGCRWGGDYRTTLDQMHFEFMGTPDDARRMEEDDLPSAEEIAEAVWGHRLAQFESAGDEGWDDGKRRADYILRFAAARAHSAPERTWTDVGIETPEQWRDPGNPRWQPRFALDGVWQQATSGRIASEATARSSGVEVDEQALAADILAGLREHLTVDQLAELVTGALGEELAGEVLAQMGRRLSQSSGGTQ